MGRPFIETTATTGQTISSGARLAFDYDNTTQLNDDAYVFVDAVFTTTLPTAGNDVLELFCVPSDAALTYANGGDGTTGDNKDPANQWSLGTAQVVAPSTTTSERYGFYVPLHPYGNRMVLKNVAGTGIHFGSLSAYISPRRLTKGRV